MLGLPKNRTIRHSLRRAALRFAAIAIGCQFLVPTGYMPGSFADGTPFVLCDMFSGDVGHAGAMDADMHGMASLGGAHAANDAEHSNHSNAKSWEHCPLGALGAGAALAFAAEPAIAAPEPDQIATYYAVALRSAATITQRARAPPHST